MAREPADTASVFDFLFVDHARVALFNTQFTGMGSMRQIIESESTTGTKGGAVNAAVARARYDRSASQTLEKAYGAQWVEPLSFLDNAQERGMLSSDLASARVGDLVRVRARIDFLNLASLKRVWSEVAMDRPGSGGRKNRRDGGRLFADKDAELGLRIFGALEQPMIMVFRGEECRLWSAVVSGCSPGWSSHQKAPIGESSSAFSPCNHRRGADLPRAKIATLGRGAPTSPSGASRWCCSAGNG